MKSSLRKGLIAAISAVLMILVAIIIATNVNFVKAADTIAIPDDVNAPRVSGDWTDDFYVIDGASVRLETEGLKFTTVISKAYLQELTKNGATVEFFATAKKLGGTAQAVAFKYQPQVATMKDSFNLNTYLNFDNISDEDMAVACATDFVVETYAKITNGNDVSYVRAYKPANNDIARSMQAVANAHYLASGDANLKAYFTEGNRSATDTGYVSLEDGSSKFTMPKVELEGSVSAYVGTKKYTGSVDADGKLVLSGLDVTGVESAEKIDVSIFDGNTVYSTKLVAADLVLTNDNISELSVTTNGYVVLAEDIDMAGVTWTAPAFAGTLDGVGYSINNLNTTLFKTSGSATVIKNIAFLNVTTPHILYSDLYRGTVTLENAYIHTVAELDSFSGVLREVRGGATVKFKNVLVNSEVTNNTADGFASAVFAGRAYACTLTFENCYAVADASKFASTVVYQYRETNSTEPEIIGTENVDYFIYDNMPDICADIKSEKIEISDFVESVALSEDKTIYITQENISELMNATTGYYRLTEDIDMTGVTWTAPAFAGTLDGGEYSINNLNTTLFKTSGSATVIKNIAFLNVTTPHILYSDLYSGTVTLENAYIHTVAELDSFSGVLREVRGGATVKFKNVLVNSEVTNNTADDFASAVFAGRAYNCTLTFENCYAVADASKFASTVVYQYRETNSTNPTIVGTENVDYFIYDNMSDICADIKSGKIEISDFVESVALSEDKTIYITQENVSTLMNATTGYYRLASDIDLKDVVWTAPSFAGILDGGGYSIKNVSTTLFIDSRQTPIIKNIAFLDVTAPYLFYGDFAGGIATFENVYVHTKAELADFSGLLKEVRGGQVVFKNVLVNSEVTNDTPDSFASAVFAGRAYNTTLKFENCYVVGDASKYVSTVVYQYRESNSTNPTIVGTEDVNYFVCDSFDTLKTEAQSNSNMDLTASMIAKYIPQA